MKRVIVWAGLWLLCSGLAGRAGEDPVKPDAAVVAGSEKRVPATPAGEIHIDLPGRASICVEHGADAALLRMILESLRR